MKKFAVSLLALMAAGSSAYAQDAAPGACTTPDSIAVTGNSRVTDPTIRTAAGLDEIEVDLSPEGGKLDFRVLTSTTQAQ